MDAILEETMKSEEGRRLKLDGVKASLVQLGCEVSAIDLDSDTHSIGTGILHVKPNLFVLIRGRNFDPFT